MKSRPELLVMRGDVVIHTQEIGERPLHIGRAPSNDLILIDDHISWLHAVIWTERDQIWIKDLGSTNGTFINEERARAPTMIDEATSLRLGMSVQLKVRGGAPGVRRRLVLEDLAGGVWRPLRGDRFYIGSGEDCDLHLTGGPPRAATLIMHEDHNEVWLGTEEDDVLLQIGQIFDVAGRSLRIRESDRTHTPTTAEPPPGQAAEKGALYPYRLAATLQGSTGPEARLENLNTGQTHLVDAANRAILLYLLGKRWKEDQENGAALSDRGWCGDDEIASGIWGRNWRDQATNHLHVLVHRTRKEVKKVGFDPWFIEKRRRCIRVRIQEGEID